MRRAETQRSPIEKKAPNELLVAIMANAAVDCEQIEQGNKSGFREIILVFPMNLRFSLNNH